MIFVETGGTDLRARWAWCAVILLWLICAVTLWWTADAPVLSMRFSDPDDALRLVQVRDWMAGQSWFDVTQYRSQPPGGAPMHWSRLVDLPLAAALTLCGWFLPASLAEPVALAMVPLVLLLALFILVYRLTLFVSGRRMVAVMGALMLWLSLGVCAQFRPLRIDHHGWQIVLGIFAALLILRAVEGSRGHAIAAGFVAALTLEIAIEGLPMVVAMGGVLALAHLLRGGRNGSLLLAYLATLAAGGAVLTLAMLGWPAAATPWCDSLSPVYMLPLAIAACVLWPALHCLPQQPIAGRLAALALAGTAAAAVFGLGAPQCAAGPFATLDPLVYKLWYLSVSEGRPIWDQGTDIQLLVLVQSLLGIVGTLCAIWCDGAERRDRWIVLLILQSAAFIVSLLVMRAMGIAHVLAIPGAVWLLRHLFLATRRLSTPVGRIAAGVLWVGITPIGVEAVLLAVMAPPEAVNAPRVADAPTSPPCFAPATLQRTNSLAPAVILAPLDISSHLLAFTPHSVIATAHHRARWGMKAVISAMVATPGRARPIAIATPATYLAFCRNENEIDKYARDYPHSLAAALLKNRAPGWLQFVPQASNGTIRVYRILRPDPAGSGQLPVQPGLKRIATPFMQ